MVFKIKFGSKILSKQYIMCNVYEGHDMKRLIKTNVSISDWIANQRSGRVTLVGGKKCLIYLLNKLAAMVKLDNI